MQRLIFETSPVFVVACLALGLGYAYLLYRGKHPWTRRMNQLLFGLRALVVALLAFLLLGPIIKMTTNQFEKPTLVLLVDNSASLRHQLDSVTFLQKLTATVDTWRRRGYDVATRDLAGGELQQLHFTSPTSDLNGALRGVINAYEGKNLGGIILVTDGIYNSGASPLYTAWRVPVTTVGAGDTAVHADLVLKNTAYNKVAYQGNQFPVRAEVVVQHLANADVTVSIFKNGARIAMQQQNAGTRPLLTFDFMMDAKEKGMQRLDVVVEPIAGETNSKNNRAAIFVEVVEGRKKILVIAPAPHPDLKALRSAVEKNPNYEWILHIPGLTKTDPAALKPGRAELVIFHQPADGDGKMQALFAQLGHGPTSVLLLIGAKTNLRMLTAGGVPLAFANPGQKDEVTPVVNPAFHDFEFSENSNNVFGDYPPVSVPFGKFSYPPNAKVMLNQRIGTVTTDRPLLLTWDDADHKVAAFVGEGLWRWRLQEYSATEKTAVFDATFSKLIQYLSTRQDKSKFRFFPLQNEFSDDGPVVLEGQVYNDLFEKVYGNKIDLTVRDEQGRPTAYSYVLSPGGERYRIGGLREGSYQYTATTLVNTKKETVSGRFMVVAQNVEPQNLVADFALLRKLAQASGGRFYRSGDWAQLTADFEKAAPQAVIHSEASFHPLVQAKWFFFLLLALISAEWFLRKYLGRY